MTGCYYYQSTAPSSSHAYNYYYYSNANSTPNSTQFNPEMRQTESVTKGIVTEVSDDEEEIKEKNKRKKEYVDAISIDESAEFIA